MIAVGFTFSRFQSLFSDASRHLSSSSYSPFHLEFRRSRRSTTLFVVSCKSHSFSSNNSGFSDTDNDGEFVQATLLFAETVSHYMKLKYGYVEEPSWQAVRHHSALPLKESIPSIGQGILRQFNNPTVFLKISCDGDFLLPVAVGEHAVERLADSSWEAEDEDYPNQYQFIKNLVLRLGYEVDTVRITKRVKNTYFAKVCLSKPGEMGSIIIDIRPSDAINIAKRCLAPIYVSKHIVTTDVFQIAYGMIRTHPTKTVYDVILDSPPDGPDMLVKELDLVKSMNLAVLEERYNDAVTIRDQLIDHRKT